MGLEFREIERRLERLLDQSGGGLPEEQLGEIKSLVKAGEPGVALENFCSQLLEYDIAVPLDLVKELEKLGQAMGIDPEYWAGLRRS
jgi:hypothetical protein